MKSKLALVSIAGLFAVVVANFLILLLLVQGTDPPAKSGAVTVASEISIGGAFSLIDQDNNRVSDQDLRGRFLLIYFGYAHCPDVCPTTLQDMAQAMEALGADAAAVMPIFITIDPARDTPEFLKSYVSAFHPRLIGLTGSAAEIAAAAKAYRVYYAKAEGQSDDDYLMDHSSHTFLMGRDGRYQKHFRFGASPEDIAAGIRTALATSRD